MNFIKRAIQSVSTWDKRRKVAILFGAQALESPAPGLVFLDRVSKPLIDEDPEMEKSSIVVHEDPTNGRVFLPKFQFIVGPGAIDTVSRTPEEIRRRVRFSARRQYIYTLVYRPGVPIGEQLIGMDLPKVSYSKIVKMVSGRYDPALKRVYSRVEEETLRALIENGHSPLVVRYNVSSKSRERYVRIASSYPNVGVGAVVEDAIATNKISHNERILSSSWEPPTKDEGFDFIVNLRELKGDTQ